MKYVKSRKKKGLIVSRVHGIHEEVSLGGQERRAEGTRRNLHSILPEVTLGFSMRIV